MNSELQIINKENPEKIQEILKFLQYEKKYEDGMKYLDCFSFHKIINMPDEFNKYLNYDFYLNCALFVNYKVNENYPFHSGEYIKRTYDTLSREDKIKYDELAVEAFKVYKEYGHVFAKNWRMENWGIEDDYNGAEIYNNLIFFSTIKEISMLLVTLSEKFPSTEFIYTYLSFGGKVFKLKIKNGEIYNFLKPKDKVKEDS